MIRPIARNPAARIGPPCSRLRTFEKNYWREVERVPDFRIFHDNAVDNVTATKAIIPSLMDVHRSRFVPYPTSAISALAFSRSSDSGYNGPLPSLKLALGRANGDIEIWNPQRGLWVQETVFPGNNASIDGLAWTQDADERDADGQFVAGKQRLFSIASSPAVTEWDLATGLPKRQSTGNFSEVWCLAAQPRWRTGQKDAKKKAAEEEGDAPAQDLVAGCGDGTLVLLSTADDDLQFKRFLARVAGKKARCMCITYQNRDRVVAGFADSNIRIFDTRNGSMLRSMSLGVSVPGAPKSGLVWQVRCLPNGDIVSGDSNGEVKFWDGKTYSMLQRISAHDSDCLDLVTSNDGRTVMSGSIDGKIAVYRQTTGDHGRKSWAKSGHRRVHRGEVKAMAAFDSKGMSVVVSGGGDAAPMLTPLREYGKENLRSLPYLPQDSAVASARKARLLVSWWEKSVLVWRIAKRSTGDAVQEPESPRKLVARIVLDTKTNIRSVAITSDGRLLAASTGAEVKLFQLQRRVDSEGLAVRKLELPKTIATSGARMLRISDNGKWLVSVTPESEVHIARLVGDLETPKYLKVLPKVVELDRRHRTPDRSAFRDYERSITQVAFAGDSSMLVVSDLAGYLDSWVLEGHEDLTAPAVDIAQHQSEADSSDAGSEPDSSSDSSDDDSTTIFYGQHWTDNPAGHLLPKLEAPPLLLTFRPQRLRQDSKALVNGNPGVHSTRGNPHAHSHELPRGQHRLFVMTAKHQMFEFDVLAGRLSDWSRRNPTAVLPEEFTKVRDRVMGAVWDVCERRERIWLYGSSFTCMLDVGGDLTSDADRSMAVAKKRRKPKEGAEEEDDARKRVRLESGAGGRVEGLQQGSAGVVKKFENGAWTELDLVGPRKSAQDDDDDDDESDDGVDLRLTRVISDGDQEVATNGVNGNYGERKWWCTFKYRPILGMVPLEDEPDDDGKPLEVVIVERPLWDARSDHR